ncbi:Mov34/MPN/PAD-1 family protein [Pandoraea pnomenusa]|uniref:Mov34/MPN/PAD-1 family protein n=1 Tax=Pandoraea pnomenusa TaxID=93220 RepID=UPI0021500CDF|nr:Mov34/MPN/PAD-1 family protein [Pandoraea pnomenusa]
MFSSEALAHMSAHVQRRRLAKEAGGELFARVADAAGLVVECASGPHPSDKRTRCSFLPDVTAAAAERSRQYERGLHAVGLWHTHPELIPNYSHLDRLTTEQYLTAFAGERGHYLMVILGNLRGPPAMRVWSVDNEHCTAWGEVV